jgi:hypothetical protein
MRRVLNAIKDFFGNGKYPAKFEFATHQIAFASH